MLKIEDVKAGDDLECIDIAEFSKIWGESQGYDINKMENISLLEIGPYYFRLKGKFLIGNMGFDEIRPSLDCLKYFKKKEQSQQYTFDDLINMSTKAVKDRLFVSVKTDFKSIIALWGVGDEEAQVVFHNGQHNQVNCEYIQRLYKETFVIESEDDCKKIKQRAKITFLNGNSVVMDQPPVGDGIVRIWNDGRYDFTVLKGATVEQERGRDD